MKPHVKMISTEFVGRVAPTELERGDIIPEGIVLRVEPFDFSLHVEGSTYVLTTTGALEFDNDTDVIRVGRLTKDAFTVFASEYDPGFLR